MVSTCLSTKQNNPSSFFVAMPISRRVLQALCDRGSKPETLSIFSKTHPRYISRGPNFQPHIPYALLKSQAECLPQYQNSGNPVRRMSNYNRPWLTAMTGSEQKSSLDPEARCAFVSGDRQMEDGNGGGFWFISPIRFWDVLNGQIWQ